MITGQDELPEAPPIHRVQATVQDARQALATLPVEQVQSLRCMWCGGIHTTECWSIQEATFYPDGRWQSVKLSPRPQVEAATIYDEDDLNAEEVSG